MSAKTAVISRGHFCGTAVYSNRIDRPSPPSVVGVDLFFVGAVGVVSHVLLLASMIRYTLNSYIPRIYYRLVFFLTLFGVPVLIFHILEFLWPHGFFVLFPVATCLAGTAVLLSAIRSKTLALATTSTTKS